LTASDTGLVYVEGCNQNNIKSFKAQLTIQPRPES